MIINFSVENFSSIKDRVTLSFEATRSDYLEEYYIVEPKKGLRLLKLGLIYGPNASGKTNILKALTFLKLLVSRPLGKKTDVFRFEPFLFDRETPHRNTCFSIEFIQNGVKYLYNVELNRKAIVHEELFFYNPKKALVYERETNMDSQVAEIRFGSKVKVSREHKAALEANTLWNNTVLGGFLKTNLELKELRNVSEWFNNKLKPIVMPRTDLFRYVAGGIEEGRINKQNVIEILKKADIRIADINIIKEIPVDERMLKSLQSLIPLEELERVRKEQKIKEIKLKLLFFQHKVGGNFYTLPYDSESAGTQRYYQLAGLLDLVLRNEIVIPIDEIESSLHPDLIKHFLLTFLVNSKCSQLIATTHFRELLMEKNIFRTDVIWFTEIKSDGSTDLYSLADFDSSVIRKASSIYNAYKIGKLGAVPNLDDYYLGSQDGS